MKSPFPGMDPYLEAHWRDVHADFVAISRRRLNERLPGDLVARMEERVVIDEMDPTQQRVIYPDVRVYEDPGESVSASAGGGMAVAEPIIIEVEEEEHTEAYITVVDKSGQLVTVIEFLSPANKRAGADRDAYRRKRGELWQAQVNVVEVDLVRQGAWRAMLRPHIAPARAESAFRVITWRAQPHRIELVPISLRGRLPAVPIPLRPTDPAIPLDLQEVFEEVYRGGRYDHTDYSAACEPPLAEEDGAWAEQLLRDAGRRS
jgi:hypothetical protein